MTEAVTVRRDGDTFQARMFWLRAARLLMPATNIKRVAFETGPKSFDDIWVEFEPHQGLLDQYGVPLSREHVQCKWHVSPGQYGFAQIVDPEFINANARSLLQRAYDAQQQIGGAGIRFKLVTNWSVDRDDPLRLLIGQRSGSVRRNRLFDATTDRSKVGGVRKLWREHLELDDEGLKGLAGALAFGQASDNLDELREMLDLVFLAAGIRRIPASESVFPYDELIFQWMSQGRLDFDQAKLREGLRREGLLAETAAPTISVGIKSFEHPIDPLELRCAQVLDLTGEFEDRFIRDEKDWVDNLYPRLGAFLRGAARDADQCRLAIDAHATLAFAAGSILDLKCGRAIALEQRSSGRKLWSADDCEPAPDWPRLVTQIHDAHPGSPELAVAIGFTHDVLRDVTRYVSEQLPSVGKILACSPDHGATASSVRCGRHAVDLAQAMATAVRHTADGARVHLFLAAPNGLGFFLGQRRPLMGSVTLYEYDFEGTRDRSYRPSLQLP